jgi:3-hydroxyethyl bacteriochlorophyllide a dehydrogenase
MRSKAVVFTAPNEVRWMDVESPEPGDSDIVIDIHHSWISNGTEGSFLRGERLSGDEAWQPGDPMPFPMIAGYQKVGRIRSLGINVKGFEIGEMVFASMSKVTGMFDNRFAGHVSPSVCDQGAVMKIPAGCDPLAISGLVLTQVGYNCGSRSSIQPGQVAVVIGDGLVGQWAAQTLKSRGAVVVMVGKHDDRLSKAALYAHIINGPVDFGTSSFDAMNLGNVQVLVETVGSVQAMYAWLHRMNRNSHIVVAGFYKPSGQVNIQTALQDFRNYEISFDLVSGATAKRMEETMQWISDGKLHTLDLITHRFPVEEAAEAWCLIESKQQPVLGVVLDWPASR